MEQTLITRTLINSEKGEHKRELKAFAPVSSLYMYYNLAQDFLSSKLHTVEIYYAYYLIRQFIETELVTNNMILGIKAVVAYLLLWCPARWDVDKDFSDACGVLL